jgi:hypothetical protein
MATRLAAIIVVVALAAVVAPSSSFAKAKGPPRGHYQCYFYDVYGYPTLAAEIYILRKHRYAGPGKKNKGRYVVGKKTKKGVKIKFKGGAYGGWWAFYRRVKGSPYLELRNKQGEVGNGCPKSN